VIVVKPVNPAQAAVDLLALARDGAELEETAVKALMAAPAVVGVKTELTLVMAVKAGMVIQEKTAAGDRLVDTAVAQVAPELVVIALLAPQELIG
jgi:hypothetical protein